MKSNWCNHFCTSPLATSFPNNLTVYIYIYKLFAYIYIHVFFCMCTYIVIYIHRHTHIYIYIHICARSCHPKLIAKQPRKYLRPISAHILQSPPSAAACGEWALHPKSARRLMGKIRIAPRLKWQYISVPTWWWTVADCSLMVFWVEHDDRAAEGLGSGKWWLLTCRAFQV